MEISGGKNWMFGYVSANRCKYSIIATDKHLEHHLEKKIQNRHSGDVLSMKSL